MKILTIAVALTITAAALVAETPQERLASSADVFAEVMHTPDKGIPQELLDDAACIVVLPGVKKAAFVLGGQYGRGFVQCRRESGQGWAGPAAVRMEGGSVGFQIGGSNTDLILLVRNHHGMEKLLGDKFTLGADASAAAGPVGRTANASTDVRMKAEILAWSRAQGLFAGISLNGATLRPDEDVNRHLYGRRLTNREILLGHVSPPASAHRLIAELNRYSPHREGEADRSEHR